MSQKEVVSPPRDMLQPSRWSDRPKLLSLRRRKWRRHACGYRRQGHFKYCALISQIECLLWASQAAMLLRPWGSEEVSGCSEWGRLHQQDDRVRQGNKALWGRPVVGSIDTSRRGVSYATPCPRGWPQSRKRQVAVQRENGGAAVLGRQAVLSSLVACRCPWDRCMGRKPTPLELGTLWDTLPEHRRWGGWTALGQLLIMPPMVHGQAGLHSILPKLRSAAVRPCPVQRHVQLTGRQGRESPSLSFSKTSGGRLDLAHGLWLADLWIRILSSMPFEWISVP